MPSDTASTSSRLTIPISPTFSTDTTSSAPRSEATTDETPDLGAFTQILWAWNNLQPAPRAPVPQFHPPPSSQSLHTVNDHSSVSSFTHPGLSEASGTESIALGEPPETVWNQHQLQSYFNLNSITPSTRVHELDENEYDISIANDYPDQGYEETEEPPPPSPFSNGSQTVEIYDATSDFEIPETVSLHDAAGQSPTRRPMVVPVMGPSPSRRRGSGGVSSGSDVEGNAVSTSRGELQLHGPHFSTNSFGRTSLGRQVAPLRERGSPEGIPVHITPRQADFPIHDHSSVHSQSTARTTGTRTQKPAWSRTQLNRVPESPQDALVDDTSSLSSHPTQDDSEDAVQSLLDKARVARSVINDNSSMDISVDTSDDHSTGTRNYGPSTSHSIPYYRRELDPAPRATPPRPIQTHTFSPQVEPPSPLPTPEDSEVFMYSPRQRHLKVESVDEDQSRTPTRPPARTHGHILPQQMADSSRYLEQGVAHPYPHPLKGRHGLPITADPSERRDDPPRMVDGFGEPSGDDLDGDQPSLGLLDEALSFIAAERARYEALRASGAHQGDGGLTPLEWQHVVDTSNTKRKRRKKTIATAKAQDNFPSQVSRTPSAVSNTRPLLLAADPDNAFLESDHDTVEATTTNILHATNDKRIMILTRPKPPVTPSSGPRALEEPIRLTGKKGKRVGRKEREREKAKRDGERAALEAAEPERPTRGDRGDDWELDGGKDEGDDEVDGEDEGGEEDGAEGDAGFSSSGASVTNIHAIRASAGSRAYIHEVGPGKGFYKSTPATPRAISPTKANLDHQGHGDLVRGGEQDMDEPLVIIPPVKVGRSRKKSRKRPKTLEHAKSYPNLRHDAILDPEEQERAPQALPLLDQSKRSRLTDLASRLEAIFPEQNKDLKDVIQRLEGVTRRKVNLARTGSIGSGKGRSRHSRNGSLEGHVPQDISAGVQGQDPIELEVVGQTPVAFDGTVPLIHVFIDHSNILIGLLNFLKRSPPPRGIVTDYLASRLVQTANSTQGKASSSSPIAIPHLKNRASGPLIEESPADSGFEYPIPLPSFATAKAKDTSLSKSLPIESALDAHMSKKGPRNRVPHAAVSDASEPDREEGEEGGNSSHVEKKAARFPRHLWHAALVLVLERGRAISRRVVVTSSPLYQPMENIQTLGYEVRVYMRVPNLGDGMDQERKKARYSASRSIYNAKGSPTKKTHMRHVSGSTSAESGSGGLNLQAHTAGLAAHNAATNNAAITKVKYREQGVDELLQLKLHQAIADVDVVPSGSTIVLATGDGNVGQFNEDGFLGPVRTALKRGWKVELYAWEDGLSRAWRREFGENSEWGKKGVFRIIPLEQFATSLVEAAGW